MTQTAAWKTESEATEYAPFAMVRLDLPSGTVRFFTGIGELSWNSQTWTGAGDLGVIGPIESGTDLKAGSVQVGLTGLDATIKADALNELTRGADVYIYFGFFNVSTQAIIVDPWLAYFGKIDGAAVSEDADGVSVVVDVIDGVGARLRRTEHRRTDANQQDIFAGDEVFEYVADTAPQPWGAPHANSEGGAAGNSVVRDPPGPGNSPNLLLF